MKIVLVLVILLSVTGCNSVQESNSSTQRPEIDEIKLSGPYQLHGRYQDQFVEAKWHCNYRNAYGIQTTRTVYGSTPCPPEVSR